MATTKTCKERVTIAKKHSVKATSSAITLEKCLAKGGSCVDERRAADFYLNNFMIFVGHVNSTCSGGVEASNLVMDQALEVAKATKDIQAQRLIKNMRKVVVKKKR